MEALRFDAATRHYAGRAAVADVTLSVPGTATVVLAGPNGAGKTTLLRLAATLVRPTAGRVFVAGHDTRTDALACRRQLAYTGQDAPLYAELTPAEHVAWWSRLHGRPTDARRALADAGLSAQADAPCRTLSRGQRQRTALACALAAEPPLLLLDEPFAFLDGDAAAWLEARLVARRGHAATLLVDHDASRAARLADHIATIRAGRLEAIA